MHRVLYTFHVPSIGEFSATIQSFKEFPIKVKYFHGFFLTGWNLIPSCPCWHPIHGTSPAFAPANTADIRWFCPPPKKTPHKTALFHTIFIALLIKTPFCNSILRWALQPTPDVLNQLNALSRKKKVFPVRPWSDSLIAGPWRRNDRVLDQDSYDFSLRVHHGLKAMASSNKDISMQKKNSPSKSQINQIHGYIVNPCLLNVLNAFLFQPHNRPGRSSGVRFTRNGRKQCHGVWQAEIELRNDICWHFLDS